LRNQKPYSNKKWYQPLSGEIVKKGRKLTEEEQKKDDEFVQTVLELDRKKSKTTTP
jgi:hypothetical protein